MWDEERDRKVEKEGVIWKQGASKEEIKGVRKLTGKDCYWDLIFSMRKSEKSEARQLYTM